MPRAEFRPCIDLHNGVVKQIVGGTLDDAGAGLRTNFVSAQPPAAYARRYRRDGLRGGHVIMLGPGNEEAARDALSGWPGGMQVGGGITADNAAAWLDAGAEKLIVTSFVFAGGELRRDRLEELKRIAGRDRLVLDLSCRRRDGRYWIVTDRWQRFTRCEVDAAALDGLSHDCAEFLIHAVDVEGRCAGIDRDLLALLAADSPLPCVYAGGIRSFDDIAAIEEVGRGRIHYTIGSALDIFGGALSYDQVVAHARA